MRSSLLSDFARGLRCTRIISPAFTTSVSLEGSLPTAPLGKAFFAHLMSAMFKVPEASASGASSPSLASGIANSSAKPSLADFASASKTKATRQSPISFGPSKAARRVFQSLKLSHVASGPRYPWRRSKASSPSRRALRPASCKRVSSVVRIDNPPSYSSS